MTSRLENPRVRWTAIVVVLVLAVAALVALGLNVTSGPTSVRSLPAAAAPGVHEVRAAAVTPLARPTSTGPHDAVAPAAPTGFQISGAAFDIRANVCGMANVRPLDPPGDQYHTVCWVQAGFGVAPGSDSGGTSYILGHSWAEAPLVLTPLSTTAMANIDMNTPQLLGGVPTYPTTAINGYRITLTTPTGLLTYTVDSAYAVNKMQAANVAPLMDEHTPNRVVIITCGVNNGRDIDVNIIVNATLTSSRAI